MPDAFEKKKEKIKKFQLACVTGGVDMTSLPEIDRGRSARPPLSQLLLRGQV